MTEEASTLLSESLFTENTAFSYQPLLYLGPKMLFFSVYVALRQR